MAGIEALPAVAFLRSLGVPYLRANPAGGPVEQSGVQMERSGVQLQQNHFEQPQVEVAAVLLSLSLLLPLLLSF